MSSGGVSDSSALNSLDHRKYEYIMKLDAKTEASM